MLDTNICIYVIKQRPRAVLDRLLECNVGEVGISAITLYELQYGVAKSSQKEKNAVAFAKFMAPLGIAPFDDKAASCCGEIRATTERAGIILAPMELLVAAHALSIDATLITRNTRKFGRIPGLAVADWAV